jgi:hypothetical protein
MGQIVPRRTYQNRIILSAGVSFDAGGLGNFSLGVGGTFTVNPITVGAGANRALLVTVASASAGGTISAVTWNGVGMTSLGLCTNVGDNLELFGLVNPASGAQDLAITIGTGGFAMVGAISFTGVNQSGGTTSFPGFVTSSDTVPYNVSSATLDKVIAAFNNNSDPGPFTPSPTATIFKTNDAAQHAGLAYYPGATTVSVGTQFPARNAVGCSVKAA